MGQIIGSAAKPKRCNLSQLSQLGTPAAGEHILVSSDNSMNAAGQGNFDCYIVGDRTTAATALELHKIVADDLNTNDGKSALSARQGKIIADVTMDYVESINLLDPATITADGKIIRKDNGGLYTLSSAYGHTDFFELPANGSLICNSSYVSSGVVTGAVFYDSNKTLIANAVKSAQSNGGAVVVSKADYANAAFVKFNLYANAGNQYAVYLGSTLPPEFVSYITPHWKMKDAVCDQIPTEGSTLPIASGGVYPFTKTIDDISERTLIEPKNWLDISKLETGVYYAGNTKYTNSSYNASGLIPVKEGETYIYTYDQQYYLERSIRFLNGYDENGNYISQSYKENITSYTVPSGVKFVRISATSNFFNAANKPMFYYGERTNLYSAYFAPYHLTKMKENKVQFGEKFAGINYTGAVAANERKETSVVHIPKDFALTCQINSAMTDVLVGLNYNSNYGRWYEITGTSIIVKTSEGVVHTYSHGLTISEKTTLIVYKETAMDSGRVVLMDGNGSSYSFNDEIRVISGAPFVLNLGASSINVALSFMPRKTTADIWLFGDSYLSYLDPARWLYYPISWGFDNYLLNALGGINSADSLIDLQNILATGARPSYLVWCLGMNDGADQTAYNQPSFAWKDNLNIMLSLCSQYGIIPILATIPTIPNASHALLNAWVRNSGYRYIDFAAAVEETGTDYWKNYGEDDAMLSSDLVHPTMYGAKALAAQAVSDFPEITLSE